MSSAEGSEDKARNGEVGTGAVSDSKTSDDSALMNSKISGEAP